MTVVALLPIALSNANVNMFFWLFCGGGNTFVQCTFNPTISIPWTIVFVFAITWCCGSFVCSGDSLIMLFNYSACIFHTTIAHFILCSLLDFEKFFSNELQNIFGTFVVTFLAFLHYITLYNIILFNRPFSKNITRNVAKLFFRLLDKKFAKSNKLHQIFNINTR